MSAALGAATGELVFSEIMLGQFGGLGEVEKFLTVTIGVYVAAGWCVTRPTGDGRCGGHRRYRFAAVYGHGGGYSESTVCHRGLEAVAGLPESVFATEGFAFLNDLLFSGILFCLLPTLYLVPKLHGKIEPLLGMQPRTPKTALEPQGAKAVLGCIVGFGCCCRTQMLAKSGMSLVDWEAPWSESMPAFATAILIAAALCLVAVLVIRKQAEQDQRG